ncbi:hypothetical protein TRIP_B40199 [uncultured Desulfatiglans sp.]|uniref:PAS domain S-box protein n=1 Tax=Uncultured Desulfatiglans sp. TaxID=1748965 RepID=A0A653ADZ0_UNCDX|nr:hypothetical protein TRIP_B40199 [uncultured Desulfatiglans sp.]
MEEDHRQNGQQPTGIGSLQELLQKAEGLLKHQVLESNLVTFPEDRQDVLRLVRDVQICRVALNIQHEELLKTKRELAKSNQTWFDVFDYAPTGFFILDRQRRILQVNRAGARLLGSEKDEVKNQVFSRFVAPEHTSRFLDHLQDSVENQSKTPCELALQMRNGNQIFVLAQGQCLPSRKSRTDLFLMAVMEITDRKISEKALQTSERRYRSIFENLQDVYYEAAMDGTILELSPSIENISNYKREALIGRCLYDFYVDPNKRNDLLNTILKYGKVIDYEVNLKDKNNISAFFLITAKLLRDENNAPIKITGLMRNIDELKRAQGMLNAILAASPVGIFLIQDNKITWANEAIYKILSYEFNTLIGQNTIILYTDRTEYERAENYLNEAINQSGIAQIETQLLRKDGSLIDCYIYASPLEPHDINKGIIRAVLDITVRKNAEEQINLLSQELMRAHENERKMISSELHDRIGQDLSTLKIGLDTLLDNQPIVSQVTQHRIAELSSILQTAIHSVRDLSYDLRPPSLDQLGLPKTIFQFCDDFSKKTGLDVDFSAAGMDDLALDTDTEINIYRLIQEGLNNVRKHAEAENVFIRLLASFPNILLRIEDDGKGFDVKQRLADMKNEKRMGLRSMEERAKLLQGKMEIKSKPGKGTKIVIEIPYKKGPDRASEKKTHLDR